MPWWKKSADSHAESPDVAGFEAWLDDMGPRVDRFRDFLAPAHGVAADFSRSSLQRIESWLLNEYPDLDTFLERQDLDLLDGLTRYVGEVFVRNLDGSWTLDKTVGSVYTGIPVVVVARGKSAPLSPLHLLRTAVDRRTGVFLTGVFDAQRGLLPSAASTEPQPEATGWWDDMPESLSQWIATSGSADSLDFSLSSLDKLAHIVMANHSSGASLDGAARYLGEVIRQRIGGQWVYRPGPVSDTNPYEGRPFISRDDANGDPVAVVPEFVIEDIVEQQSADAISRAIERYRAD